MSVNVGWDNPEKSRIILSFKQPWTWVEFNSASDQMDQLFTSVTHRVDLIIDITYGGFPPGNAIPHFKRVSETPHANLGQIVVVGVPGFFRAVLNIIKNVYRGRYEAPDFLFFSTLEKAREHFAPPAPGSLLPPQNRLYR